MITEVYMPKNGMDMTEGVLVRWLKQEGERVEAGEPIMEIETDKISMEAEAPASGILLKQLFGEDEIIPVLTTVGYIGEEGDVIPDGTAPVQAAAPAEEEVPAAAAPVQPLAPAAGTVAATPYAKFLAVNNGVDLASVQPSGSMGEVKARDVEAAMTRQPAPADAVAIPMSSMRKVIAQRMVSSHTEIPTVTACVKVDMTKLLALREQINAGKDKADRISINDFIVKATGKALLANERFRMTIQGDCFYIHNNIDVGVAVGMEDGLLVPVVRNVDTKTLSQISAEVKALAASAREGKLKPQDMGNACISISNMGMFGTYYFTPIINQPEASILGVCAIEDELALVNGEVTVKKVSLLATTFDHRILNGTEAAKFQADLKALLENPLDILL